MGQFTLQITYEKNTGQVFSVSELKSIFLTGISLADQDGNPVPNEVVDFYIEAAQTEIANTLIVKLTRQAIAENRDFNFEYFNSWMYVPLQYSAVKAYSLQGFLGTSLQLDYPTNWLSTKTQSPDQDMYYRSMNLVPISGPGGSIVGNTLFVGITPYLGFGAGRPIPNYLSIKYLTGFLKVPSDILRAIGLTASISILTQLSDLLSGQPGVNSKSIGIDGLSQSSSLQGFWRRIESMRKELDRITPLMRSRYCGITIGSL